MNTNLLDFVLAKLDERSIPWVRVSREAGIPYETLKKIAHRRTPNPGIRHVQALADYFTRSAAPEPADQGVSNA